MLSQGVQFVVSGTGGLIVYVRELVAATYGGASIRCGRGDRRREMREDPWQSVV
jgi:hypothetical protein